MSPIRYRTIEVEGIKVFYREAPNVDAPKLLLLRGFPTAGHKLRELFPLLGGKFHLVAPDLPSFGLSDMPSREEFNYTFENIARVIERFTEIIGFDRFALYLFDYGAPTGFRMAVRHPDRITAIISQNGNAYEEGLSNGWAPIRAYWEDASQANRKALRDFLTPETTRRQYTHGVPDPTAVSPDGQNLDNYFITRPGADEVQLDPLAITRAMLRSTRHSNNTSGHTSRRFWRCGATTIRSSFRRAPKRFGATFQRQRCASSTSATSRWRRTAPKSRRSSAISWVSARAGNNV